MPTSSPPAALSGRSTKSKRTCSRRSLTPARIRILEILAAGDEPTPVSEILAATDIEPTLLSQHLAVLKRHDVVSSERVGNAVYYRLAHPSIRVLLVTARSFLADTLKARHQQLEAFDACRRSGTRRDREGGRPTLAAASPPSR